MISASDPPRNHEEARRWQSVSRVLLSLQQAYEVVQGRIDSKGRDVHEYLKTRFSNCTPSWHGRLAQIRWRRIWTLNIDDVVERAYERTVGTQYGRKVIPLDWISSFRELDVEEAALQIIHLHGFAPNLSRDNRNLVFSIVEYLQAVAPRYTWHRVFGDSFLQRPFIVIGARMSDEYDLAECLRRGSTSEATMGRPSMVVLRTISPIQKQQFQMWGLHPVEAEAATFLDDELVNQVEQEEKRLGATIPGPKRETLPREARIFLQQFQELRLDGLPTRDASHDLYQGDDPIWEDVLQKRIAPFPLANTLADEGLKQLSSSSNSIQKVHCIWGPAGSGKSCILLSIADKLVRSGVEVFVFRAEQRLNAESVLWWLARSSRSVIMIDGVADFAYEVGELAEEARKKNISLLMFSTERTSRIRQVLTGVPPQFLLADEEHHLRRLLDVDIKELLEVLTEHRRLGRITGLPYLEQVHYFQGFARRDLLAGMANLEGAKGFIDKIVDEFQSPDLNKTYKTVYAVCSMCYALGLPCPIGVLSVAAGLSTQELISGLRVGGVLAGIIRTEQNGIRPRHRIVASTVIQQCVTLEERFAMSLALAKALSPLVTRQAIHLGTRPYRIAQQLLDEELVWAWMGRGYAQQWYEELTPFYSWNARFWEQRALLESRFGVDHLPKARSFASEAVRVHKDPFTLNTLGTILLRMAVNYHTPGSDVSRELLWNGIQQIRESRDMAEGRYEHPFVTFFSYIIHYAKAALEIGAVERRLSSEWNVWLKAAQASQAFAHPQLFDELEGFRHQWLSLAVQGA